MAQLLCCFIPVLKLRDGIYLIGSKVQALEVNAENEVILADKLVSLEDYLVNFGVIECLLLDKMMIQNQMSFKDIVAALLRKCHMDPYEIGVVTSGVS